MTSMSIVNVDDDAPHQKNLLPSYLARKKKKEKKRQMET